MKVVIYGRVSTQQQDYGYQIEDLKAFAKRNNWQVVKIFTEKISGAVKNDDRIELLKMIDYIKSNSISKVLVSELSRLGRNTLEVLKSIELLNEHKVSLYIKNYNLETLNEKGEENPIARFMVMLLAEIGSMERKQIRDRMKVGYANYIQNGGITGRKPGQVKTTDKMKEEYAETIRLLKKGISIRNISKITKESPNTVLKIKKLFVESEVS